MNEPGPPLAQKYYQYLRTLFRVMKGHPF